MEIPIDVEHAYSVIGRVIGGMARENRVIDVPDLSQSAMLNVLEHIDKYDRTRPLGPWVAAIARNTVIDNLRRLNGKPEGHQHHDSETILAERTASQEDAEELLDHDLRRVQTVAKIVLHPEMHYIFDKYYREQRSLEQIAHDSNWTIGKVKTSLFRAREYVRYEVTDSHEGLTLQRVNRLKRYSKDALISFVGEHAGMVFFEYSYEDKSIDDVKNRINEERNELRGGIPFESIKDEIAEYFMTLNTPDAKILLDSIIHKRPYKDICDDEGLKKWQVAWKIVSNIARIRRTDPFFNDLWEKYQYAPVGRRHILNTLMDVRTKIRKGGLFAGFSDLLSMQLLPLYVNQAISALHIDHAEIMRLRYLQNMQPQEMSHKLHVKYNTIRGVVSTYTTQLRKNDPLFDKVFPVYKTLLDLGVYCNET